MLTPSEIGRGVRRRIISAANRSRFRFTGETVPGLLSVVIPMYNVQDYIVECVESVLQQDYADVQIVVVDDGSPDESYARVRAVARNDARVEIVRQKNQGLSGARNTGVEHARGEFLAFLDSDDLVTRRAYAKAIDSLEQSGSDFAVLSYERLKSGERVLAGKWIRDAHARNRTAVTLESYPEIMVNAVAWSKVYRRTFWDSHSLSFPVGKLYEDQAVSMKAYVSAQAIDVLKDTVVKWRIRDDSSSITQSSASARNLVDHGLAIEESLRILREEAAPQTLDARVLQYLNFNMGEFLPQIPVLNDESWNALRDGLQELYQFISPELWSEVEVRRRILIGLSLIGDRGLAEAFLAQGGWERDHVAGAVEGVALRAEVPLAEELALRLPEETFLFGATESRLEAVHREFEVRDDRVELRIMAHIRHLRIDHGPYIIRAWMGTDSDPRALELEVTREQNEHGVLGLTRRYADMSFAGARIVIPFSAQLSSGKFQITVEVQSGEVRRASELYLDAESVLMPMTQLGESGNYLVVRGRDERPLELEVLRPGVTVEKTVEEDGELELYLRSEIPLDSLQLVTSPGRRSEVLHAEALTFRDGMWIARVSPSAIGTVTAAPALALKCFDQDGKAHLPVLSQDQLRSSGRDGGVWEIYRPLPRRGERADWTAVANTSACAVVTDAQLGRDELRVTLRATEATAHLDEVRAVLQGTEIPAQIIRGAQSIELRFPLWSDVWGTGRTLVGPGWYQLQGTDAAGSVVNFRLAHEVTQQFPIRQYSEVARLIVMRGGREQPILSIRPPRRPEEWGRGGQLRLQDWANTLRPDESRKKVLFRNRWGEHANDSGLALHRELEERGEGLELIWAVKDFSQRVPEGATVVLENTQEFYEALGTANYLMINVHQPDWLESREGQTLIQAHHGYPFKLQGRRWWKQLGYSAARVESFMQRADDWDVLISPAAYATPILAEYYREGEAIPSEVLEIGYPRNDALLDENAVSLRDLAREKLGIREHQRAVLYAPTYRDTLSAGQMSATMNDHLDPAELSRRLGEDYVVLLRGHPFTSQTDGTSNGVLDVSEHPDINHLILASDFAVLDYSSLRFDWALTGKPAYFFVPDQDEYFAERESFLAYSETIYGPSIYDLETLVAEIKDSEKWTNRWEAERLKFVGRYMELEDGAAAARLVDRVFVPRGDASPSHQ